jgi:hypothetical protein
MLMLDNEFLTCSISGRFIKGFIPLNGDVVSMFRLRWPWGLRGAAGVFLFFVYFVFSDFSGGEAAAKVLPAVSLIR